MNGIKLYQVTFNPFIHESAYETISIHFTKRGAVKSMIKLKEIEFNDPYFDEDWQKFRYKISVLKD